MASTWLPHALAHTPRLDTLIGRGHANASSVCKLRPNQTQSLNPNTLHLSSPHHAKPITETHRYQAVRTAHVRSWWPNHNPNQITMRTVSSSIECPIA